VGTIATTDNKQKKGSEEVAMIINPNASIDPEQKYCNH